MDSRRLIERCRVKPGTRARLDRRETDWCGLPELAALSKGTLKRKAKSILASNIDKLADSQELLWSSGSHGVLVVLQAMDAAGKDGTIKHVMSGINPQGCRVVSFGPPSDVERRHSFLWRCQREAPGRGRIVIFNRSHYEDVLVVRVHPHLLDRTGFEGVKPNARFWRGRYDDINAFERHLSRNGTLILKFFLHVSKEEQRSRFLERLENPEKHWKFSAADIAERGHWDKYRRAYDDALTATSTEWAPWHVIPADHKWVARAVVAEIMSDTIAALDLRRPKATDEQRALLVEARKRLLAEGSRRRSSGSA